MMNRNDGRLIVTFFHQSLHLCLTYRDFLEWFQRDYLKCPEHWELLWDQLEYTLQKPSDLITNWVWEWGEKYSWSIPQLKACLQAFLQYSWARDVDFLSLPAIKQEEIWFESPFSAFGIEEDLKDDTPVCHINQVFKGIRVLRTE